jgi:hypothetical protein
MGTVFLDAKWCILIAFLPRKESIMQFAMSRCSKNCSNAFLDKHPRKDTSFFNILMHALTLHT